MLAYLLTTWLADAQTILCLCCMKAKFHAPCGDVYKVCKGLTEIWDLRKELVHN